VAKALPGRTEKEISTLTRRLFMNYSTYLVDYGRFTSMRGENVTGNIVVFDGKENLEAALAMKKGIILLTAHLGNWELGGIFFGNYGLKINVVTIQDSNPRIDEMRRSYRKQHNVNTITIGDSPFSTVEMLRALNEGEVVAMLIDRYHNGLDYMETDFFGRTARFPKGPFTLSRLTGAPIIMAFVIREAGGYTGIIEPPMVVVHESNEADVLKKVVTMLEQRIVKYPDQWYNFTPIQIGENSCI
jgi:lauroyl/myristoyl acyltransferase